MNFLLSHWHCILPILGIGAAWFLMSGKESPLKKHKWLALSAAVVLAALLVVAFNLTNQPTGSQTADAGGTGGAGPTGGNGDVGDAAAAVAGDGGDMVIAISEVSEAARFYPAEIDGVKLEVIAVKAPDGTIRTAFNTCQVCYDSGRGYYKQDGDVLVCQNCGNRFSMSQVEVLSGGCNPVPIFAENKTVDEASITISAEFLKKAAVIFNNWKS
jgi:hypothetical protein